MDWTLHIGARKCNSSCMNLFQVLYEVCLPSWQGFRVLIEAVVDNVQPGEPFEVKETGWGEFEVTIKIHYVPESLEKAQTLYHHLRLHPYGDTDEEKEQMRAQGEIRAWVYDEQLFNEPYENFYEILTTPLPKVKGGGGKGTKSLGHGMVGSTGERTTQIPLSTRPEQPFSRETERLEVNSLKKAQDEVIHMTDDLKRDMLKKEELLAQLKAQLAKT